MTFIDDRLADIRTNPDRHRHATFDDIAACAMDPECQCVNLAIIDAHEGLMGGPTGRCDVKEGPCACGGWH